ncbi:hypothetical protein DL240_11220 [Lujinxingia litoralis]|uniref:Uncharacterized protein n=1 Tax=Lujinxingia litoralis TaxID=2211119 RepID=A0A328C7M3_9DELT|nr:hypothetical protein [Lujinxingia litoralis]RAL22410.1 hypothetical protein DL240_11220 [Lujinxingia litoralis]
MSCPNPQPFGRPHRRQSPAGPGAPLPRRLLTLLTLASILAACHLVEPPAPDDSPAPATTRLSLTHELDRLHAQNLPALFDAIGQSSDPPHDLRILQARDEAAAGLSPRLSSLLGAVISRFDGPHVTADAPWLHDFIHDWNAEMAALHQPYRLVHGLREHHGLYSFAPQFYRIVGVQEVRIEGQPYPVEWLQRLDSSSRATPASFFDHAHPGARVFVDRALHTIWNHLGPALLATSSEHSPAARQALRDELHAFLGADLDALLKGITTYQSMTRHRADLDRLARRCGLPTPLPPLSPAGYPASTLHRLQERLAPCPGLPDDAFTRLKRLNHALQHDPHLQRALQRLLQGLLSQQARAAATQAHLHARYTATGQRCQAPGCDALRADQAAEVGAYLVATTSGALPLTMLWMLLEDHRYASAAAASHWLRALRDADITLNAPRPTRLRALATAHLGPLPPITAGSPPALRELPPPRPR